MFENLTDRLSRTLKNLRGQGRLTEDNISAALREVRMALLEADVALPVVKEFIDGIKTRALGQEVQTSLTPGQALIKIVQDALVELMGAHNEALDLRQQPPAVILLAGLQGAGKTTSAAKLARFLKEREKKSVMMVSADVYRPAAIEQLRVLSEQVGAQWIASEVGQSPVKIVNDALDLAKRQHADVLIVDTAGRLHVDTEMMDEVQAIHRAIHPVETLFVVDSMTGQDAANTAKAFHEALPLTGVILTKADGDARGGAALSIRQITGRPIKFLGMGEKTDALEPFHPERMASRILGMGDVLSLIEEVERKVDKDKAEKLAKKVQQGKGFTLVDFREQLIQMRNLGGMSSLLDKLPGMGDIPDAVKNQVNDGEFVRMQALIDSMTPQERKKPDVINGSRKRRIAAGAGLQIQDLNRLLKQFGQMQKMMKKMKGGKMAKMAQKLGGLKGMKGLPPGGGMGGGFGGGMGGGRFPF